MHRVIRLDLLYGYDWIYLHQKTLHRHNHNHSLSEICPAVVIVVVIARQDRQDRTPLNWLIHSLFTTRTSGCFWGRVVCSWGFDRLIEGVMIVGIHVICPWRGRVVKYTVVARSQHDTCSINHRATHYATIPMTTLSSSYWLSSPLPYPVLNSPSARTHRR